VFLRGQRRLVNTVRYMSEYGSVDVNCTSWWSSQQMRRRNTDMNRPTHTASTVSNRSRWRALLRVSSGVVWVQRTLSTTHVAAHTHHTHILRAGLALVLVRRNNNYPTQYDTANSQSAWSAHVVLYTSISIYNWAMRTEERTAVSAFKILGVLATLGQIRARGSGRLPSADV